MDAQRRLILKRVGIVTAMSVLASVVISLIIFYAATGSFIGVGLGLMIAVIAPGIIAPIASWHSISLSLRLRQANQRLRILSELDSLTSTLNRRTFMETADKHLSLAARHGYPTSLLVLDFDHFKQINDRYGHAMGDQVLVETIDLIRDTIRETDVLARIGGEEFIILLPHTAWEGARLLAERILEVIRNNQIRQRAATRNDTDDTNHTLNVTVTVGGATCATSTTNLDEMMSRADKLLYEAKQAGRDRCVIEAISGSKPVELSRVS